ncbi:MAG: TonB family protein, partial [Armatimonadota bacterium]
IDMRASALISVAVHFVLVVLISLLMRPGEIRAEEDIIPVRLVSLEEEQPPIVPAASIGAVIPGPPLRPRPEPTKAPMGGINPEVTRKPKEAPAPPKVLTSEGGERDVAEGIVDGTGTAGTGTEPAGPSYGPGFEPGPLPVYPKNALDQNLEGTVTLTVTVSPEGKVAAIRVTGSSGSKLLDDAAQRAVAKWIFTPGMKNGTPASGDATVKIRFASNAVEQL